MVNECPKAQTNETIAWCASVIRDVTKSRREKTKVEIENSITQGQYMMIVMIIECIGSPSTAYSTTESRCLEPVLDRTRAGRDPIVGPR